MRETTFELVFPRSGQRLQVRGAGLDVATRSPQGLAGVPGRDSALLDGNVAQWGFPPSPGGKALQGRQPGTMIRLWPAWGSGNLR